MNNIKWICPHCFYENNEVLQTELSLPVILYCNKCNYSTNDLRPNDVFNSFLKEQKYIYDTINKKIPASDDFMFRWQNFHYKYKEV